LFSEDDIRKAAEEISRLPWFVADTTQSGAGLKTPRRRKRTGGQQQQPLTEKQMEAVKLHGDCEGNISEVGRRLGIDRKSAEQRIKSGFAKIGKTVPKKAKTQKLKRGNRGEDDVAEEDDKRR
jgi:DNA-directed RNA polymerase specialized sigma24 family protein